MKFGVFVQFGLGLPVCKSWRATYALADNVAARFRRAGHTASVFPIYEASNMTGQVENDTAPLSGADGENAGAAD